MILFLAKYPQGQSVKEGMSQRILNIDSFYKNDERVYLNVFLFRNLKKKKRKIENIVTEIECNTFLHFFTILIFFLKAKKVYIHSIYNVLPSLLYIFFIRNHYILDIHGVVPEENKLVGKNFRACIFNQCENILFKKKNIKVIAVTDTMINFYRNKYTSSKVEYYKYIIFPNNIIEDCVPFDNHLINTDKNCINIVYSGNTQKWQNIELMIQSIKNNLDKNYHFYILTGELEKMKAMFELKIDDLNKITIISLNPEELSSYYQFCQYGFVLRDDIVVNRVACPTKIIEYMKYGIIPIVLNEHIGDFNMYGFEYVKLDRLSDLQYVERSNKNIEIINDMVDENNLVRVNEI